MTYEAWRISYQSSEQAARAAYAECARLQAKIEAMEKQVPVATVDANDDARCNRLLSAAPEAKP